LLRFLGLADDEKVDANEPETVRRIAAQLDNLPPEQARYLATFSYVLARIANADLEIDDSEVAEMERIVHQIADLSESEAVLVVQIAKSQAQHLGGTDNYVVTREFRKHSTPQQRAVLLQCIYAVAAADGTISGAESTAIMQIAEELGFTRSEANSLRAQYRDKLAEFQKPAGR
jgi:uncharacterized tellurite resistance protein B-like protein